MDRPHRTTSGKVGDAPHEDKRRIPANRPCRAVREYTERLKADFTANRVPLRRSLDNLGAVWIAQAGSIGDPPLDQAWAVQAGLDPLTPSALRRAALGPGWSRRVKGQEVTRSNLPGAPIGLSPETEVRVSDLRAASPPSERQVLDLLELDPGAQDRDLAHVLGITLDAAKKRRQRLLRRAAGF